MNFNLKKYKINSLKTYIKKNNLFFIYNESNLKFKDQLKINQTLFKNNLTCLKTCNSTFKKFFKLSIFNNLKIMLSGPITLITFKTNLINNKTYILLKNLNPSMTLVGIKLNKKFYSTIQTKKISTLNYKKNIEIFNKSLTNLLKITNKKLKNNSK